MTDAGTHLPVLVAQALLPVRFGGTYAQCTASTSQEFGIKSGCATRNFPHIVYPSVLANVDAIFPLHTENHKDSRNNRERPKHAQDGHLGMSNEDPDDQWRVE